MIIPHRLLSADALRGVIEAFVTREGTDYGMQEVPLATKVCQVQHQLDAGTAAPRLRRGERQLYDPAHGPACETSLIAPGHVQAHTARLFPSCAYTVCLIPVRSSGIRMGG